MVKTFEEDMVFFLSQPLKNQDKVIFNVNFSQLLVTVLIVKFKYFLVHWVYLDHFSTFRL